jgi:hypothetical protein
MQSIPRDDHLARLERALEQTILGLANGTTSIQEAEAIIKGVETYVDLIDLRDAVRLKRDKYGERGTRFASKALRGGG